MKLIQAQNDQAVGELAAQKFIEVIGKKKDAVLGLATGTSPLSTYSALVNAYRNGKVSFREVRTLNLDEYVGLTEDDEQSYHRFMRENLFDPTDISLENTHVPCGTIDPEIACKEYDALLDRYPIDLQLLGIGGNGHIGFNEPGTPFTQRTHLVNLTEKTRHDNARLFASLDDVPKQAVTTGIYDILRAKELLLVVMGENKAEAVAKMLRDPISEDCPATVLRDHPHVTVIADAAALKLLKKEELEALK